MPATAVFDFDKTIISTDTYEEFLTFLIRRSIFRSAIAIVISPLLGAIFFINATRLTAINTLAAIALIGQRENLFSLRKKFFAYFYSSANARYYPEAINAINHHRAQNHNILILSGCPSWLLKSVLRKNSLGDCSLVASKQILVLGCLKTIDYCYSHNKLIMAEKFGFSTDDWYSGYSDSLSDLPFLEKCSKQYIVNAQPKKLKCFTGKLGSRCVGVSWI